MKKLYPPIECEVVWPSMTERNILVSTKNQECWRTVSDYISDDRVSNPDRGK
jgi:hypothetical protein